MFGGFGEKLRLAEVIYWVVLNGVWTEFVGVVAAGSGVDAGLAAFTEPES